MKRDFGHWTLLILIAASSAAWLSCRTARPESEGAALRKTPVPERHAAQEDDDDGDVTIPKIVIKPQTGTTNVLTWTGYDSRNTSSDLMTEKFTLNDWNLWQGTCTITAWDNNGHSFTPSAIDLHIKKSATITHHLRIGASSAGLVWMLDGVTYTPICTSPDPDAKACLLSGDLAGTWVESLSEKMEVDIECP